MIKTLIGQSLGRYHILEQLGEGGMAVVYKAFDTRLERNVAIKVILPGKEHSEKFLKRFEQEAKALAGLSHPNIVKVIDYGKQDELPYLVMEYLPGGTLKSKLNGKPMPWQEAVKLLIPIARALAYAHKQKIIHRDVKPSNILITDSGEPMLSDFGIAKMIEAEETMDLTGTGVGIGTPEYMSPEQAQGSRIDGRSDMYSLAVVLYELVTGRKPYQADTPYAVIIKHVNESLPRPQQFVKGLPDSLEQRLLTALAKSPMDRFTDMNDFLVALDELLHSTEARVPFNGSKFPSMPVVFGALLFLAVLVVSAFWISTGTERSKPDLSIPSPVPDAPLSVTPSQAADPLIESNVKLFPFDGEIDTRIWMPVAEGTDQIIQQDGVLIITNKADSEDVSSLIQVKPLLQDDIDFVETQIRLGSAESGKGGDISFQLATTLDNGQSLIFWCGIYRYLTPEVGCEVYGRTKESEYLAHKKPTDYDVWHTVMIELDPDLTVKFFVDDLEIGSYQPADAEQIKNRKFTLRLETWSPEQDGIEAQFDYVQIGTSK